MKGKDLQKALIDMAHRFGYRVAHTPPMRGIDGYWRTPIQADGAGWPDLLLVRERVIAVEVKGAGDRLSAEQAAWLSAFRMAGVEAHVWKERDWLDGVCEAILRLRVPVDQRAEYAAAIVEEERVRAA